MFALLSLDPWHTPAAGVARPPLAPPRSRRRTSLSGATLGRFLLHSSAIAHATHQAGTPARLRQAARVRAARAPPWPRGPRRCGAFLALLAPVRVQFASTQRSGRAPPRRRAARSRAVFQLRRSSGGPQRPLRVSVLVSQSRSAVVSGVLSPSGLFQRARAGCGSSAWPQRDEAGSRVSGCSFGGRKLFKPARSCGAE